MGQKDEYVTFSLRIPKSICNQIDAQAELTRRSRNMQCLHLLEIALDVQALRNEKLKQEISQNSNQG